MQTRPGHPSYSAAVRKLEMLSKTEDSGCILWTGYTAANGYGWVNVEHTKTPAHRLALMVSTGSAICRDLDACHTCDVRACVNAKHLYAGTRKQNMRDCSDRNRHNKKRGENNAQATLTAADVLEIRRRVALGEYQYVVAFAFGVNAATVSRISRKLWRKEVL